MKPSAKILDSSPFQNIVLHFAFKVFYFRIPFWQKLPWQYFFVFIECLTPTIQWILQIQLATLVTDSLTHCTDSLTPWRLVELIDVIPACKDANSKLFEVVTVADVDDEDRVGNSLFQIWKMIFSHKAKLLFRLWAQGLVKILKFRQDLRLASFYSADLL